MNNNKEGKPDMIADVFGSELIGAYNLGVDHCINIALLYVDMKDKYPNDSGKYNFTNLISRFKSLKK